MSIEKHSIPNSDAAIYAENANLNYFLKNTLEPDAADGLVNKQSTVKSHKRRGYKGDSTPSDIASHSRVWMYDPGRRNGSATPGKQMILDDGTERRSFTYTGSWTDIHAFLVGDAKMNLKAYSESTWSEIIVEEEEGKFVPRIQ